MSFVDDIKKFAERTGNSAEEQAVATLFKLNDLVVKRTPVDTGRARGGWIASIDAISLSGGSIDKNGQKTINKANSVAKKAPGHIYYLTNNVKYINALENGGYPSTPKKGSWIKKRGRTAGRWKILSTKGYSQQAPRGMVKVSIAEIKEEFGGR